LSVENSLLTTYLVLIGTTWDPDTWNHEAEEGPGYSNTSSKNSMPLTSGVEAQLTVLGEDALGCDGFWITEGGTVQVSTVLLSVPCPCEYQERFVHRPPNRRRKYLAGEAEGGTIKESMYAPFLECGPYQK
jgi:hypothetical protein